MKKSDAMRDEHNLKLAARRLKVIQLAEELGNISEACRRGGMKRVDFYKWKRRFDEFGIDGLKNLPPVHVNHPQKTRPEIEAKIVNTSLSNPEWGCVRLANFLRKCGISISSPTIQKILVRHNLGYREQRRLKLEEEYMT